MQRKNRFRDVFLGNGAVVFFAMTALLGSCKDEKSSSNSEPFVPDDVQATARGPLDIASQTACAVDADCAQGLYCFQDTCAFDCKENDECTGTQICDARGRCIAPDEEAPSTEEKESATAVRVLNSPNRGFKAKAGKKLSTRIQLDRAPPDGRVYYTEKRSDEPPGEGEMPSAPQVQSVEVVEENGTWVAEIPVDPGAAAGAGGGNVDIVLRSSVGSFQLNVTPDTSFAGTYVGEANVSIFGNTGLPLEFKIVTQPDDASLANAKKAWLLLDIRRGNIFSPVDVYENAPEYLSAELVYDDFLQQWVAIFENEYVLTDSALTASSTPGQIGRMLRFEIEPFENEMIIGRFTDRWEGFYDARSAAGIEEMIDVLFEGDIELTRAGSAPSFQDLDAPPDLPLATPNLIPLPQTAECDSAALFPVECAGITTNTQFENAGNPEQITCALAVADDALAGDTTGSMIAAFLDDAIADPGGLSFAEFMTACAAGTDGICVPSQEILCARQLLAHAYQAQTVESPDAGKIVEAYQSISREAFLGRQLAAFKTDADTRLKWLKTSDYPAIVTSAVKDLITTLLNEWQSKVLDVHLGVLGGYFDPSGLAVLSRTTTDPAALEARRRLFGEMIQAWRGSAESLTLAAARWDQLYQEQARRAQKSDVVTSRMFDLYLMAGILTNLTKGSGSGYQATAFGGGFASLMRKAGLLDLSFDDKVFARDAEIVVSTSLDPSKQEDKNASLLEDLRTAAQTENTRAMDSVQTVLDEAQESALNETQLTNKLNNEINDLRTELVSLCGLPEGCTPDEFRTDETCRVLPSAGQCGFIVDPDTHEIQGHDAEKVGASEAGRAVIAYFEAGNGVLISNEEMRSFNARMALELESLEAFANEVSRWNDMRGDGLAELETLFDEQNVIGNESLEALKTSLTNKARIRQEQISRMTSNLATWKGMRISGAVVDFTTATAASAAKETGDFLLAVADNVEAVGDATAEAIPKGADDVAAPARGATKLAFAQGKAGLVIGAGVAKAIGFAIETAGNLRKAIMDATLVELQEQAALDDAISENDITKIEEELERAIADNDDEVGGLQQIYDVAVMQRENELAYFRDMDELEQRRTAYLQMLEESAGYNLRVERARLNLALRENEYLSVVQTAELQYARLVDLEGQRSNVVSLVGSPGVVFARANRLAQAENRLQRAKEKLMDWLVGLEYYAVRPFMDQRVQIFLAVNPYQLEDIAEELIRLESACGGAQNEESATISIRTGLMNVTSPVVDSVTGEEFTAEERFRAILTDGYVPIDKRVRYTTDSTVGDLMKSPDRVLSATFDIDLSDFANLASTCNAKVVSIAVQLVGEIGDARPTATILYDGTSQLRSCQPDISEYIELIGPEQTNFGPVTMLRTPGRSISPIAGINTWPDDAAANATLGGLPLASQYTVLIDTEIGENGSLDWTKLDDILLKINYSYQDVFPEGQCQ